MEDLSAPLKKALQYYRSGELDQAEAMFLQCLSSDPQPAGIFHALGLICLRRGENGKAVDYLTSALAAMPHKANLYANLAVALQNLGRNESAITTCHTAIELDPGDVSAYNTMGNALREMGRLEEAYEVFEKALSLNPNSAEIWFNLGNLAIEGGRNEEALAAYRKALERNPDMVSAHLNAGDLLLQRGDGDEARHHYRQALVIQPDCPDIYFKLGNLSHQQGKLTQAVECYDYTIAFNPNYAAAYRNKGAVLYEIGRFDDAERALQDAFRISPSDGLRVKLATLVPPIVESVEAITVIRDRLLDRLDGLQHLGIKDPLKEVGNPNFFYLAYYGQNDRKIMKKVASLFQSLPVGPSLSSPAGKSSKIKVGFISRFFSGHSVGSFFNKITELLAANDAFEVFAFHVGTSSNVPKAQNGSVVRHVSVAVNLAAARQSIAAHGLDVLVYTDIGMDPLTYYLAFTRLAKVQCVMIGHLVTTGIPAMDYYLSSELIEPENAEEHYSETLVKLKGMPCYVERPRFAGIKKPRAQLGLPEDRHLYLCPMRLNKIHPDFDHAVAEILRRDQEGVAVFFRDREANDWHGLLSRRFTRVMPDLMERVVFLPWASAEDLQSIVLHADVGLDTFYYGGGVTASILFASGMPIVTWPGPLMRGRLTSGFYRKMGMYDCIAKDHEAYINIAVRLGCDEAFCESMKSNILQKNEVLYEDREIIDELSDFFKAVAHK
jgi:predicted O-linked N-acetylglucosamine transferase (SPINDLY family)